MQPAGTAAHNDDPVATEAEPDEPGELSWHQAFGWGLLAVVDQDSKAEELPDEVGSDTVSASASWLAIPVHHAQDVEVPEGWPDDLGIPSAVVAVVVTTRPAEPGDLIDFDGEITCPSGRLMVGDADAEHAVDASPGQVRIQVSLFPAEHADAVVIRVLPPLSDAS